VPSPALFARFSLESLFDTRALLRVFFVLQGTALWFSLFFLHLFSYLLHSLFFCILLSGLKGIYIYIYIYTSIYMCIHVYCLLQFPFPSFSSFAFLRTSTRSRVWMCALYVRTPTRSRVWMCALYVCTPTRSLPISPFCSMDMLMFEHQSVLSTV
jgi:hypothetical protein